MKKEKLQELRKKPLTDLEKMLQEERRKLNQFRINVSKGKVKNINQIKEIKKNIAQILTVANKK
jgi:ribosomal protein L29